MHGILDRLYFLFLAAAAISAVGLIWVASRI